MILLPDHGYAADEYTAAEVSYLGFNAVALIGDQALATEAAWRAFQSAWQANDPNGSWNTASIDITPDGMRYQWDFGGTVPDYPNDDMVFFPRVEANDAAGNPLYLFPGPWLVWETN